MFNILIHSRETLRIARIAAKRARIFFQTLWVNTVSGAPSSMLLTTYRHIPHLLSMPHDPWTTLASIRVDIPPPRVIYRPTPAMLRSLRPDEMPPGV